MDDPQQDSGFRVDEKVFKALSDRNRFSIIRMLAGGELCACVLLKDLDITQPTLSHHMSVLAECGLVNVRKSGVWSYYSINGDAMASLSSFFDGLSKAPDVPLVRMDCFDR